METKPDKQQTVTRLALCVVVAVALYAAAGKVPPLEPYRPWLEEHKVQAIAITAAILFGLSLPFSRRRRAGQSQRPRKRAPAPVRKNGGPAVREVLR